MAGRSFCKDVSGRLKKNEERRKRAKNIQGYEFDLTPIIHRHRLADFEYIRSRYGVPAYTGVHVFSDLYPNEEGIITGSDGSYVVVSFLRQPKMRIFHPKDLQYLRVEYTSTTNKGRAK